MSSILLLSPITSLSYELLTERAKALKERARADVNFGCIVISQGPVTIESRYEEELAAQGVMDGCVRAEQDGYNAVIVWCAGDPAIAASRELVKIPVIGPGESSLLFASSLARKYSIIVPYEEQGYLSEELAVRLGLADRLASVRGIEMSVLDIRNYKEKTMEKIKILAEQTIKNDGAQAIVFGCLGMMGLARKLSEYLDVPIVDPAFASLAMAESLISMGLSYSKRTYPFPPKMAQN